MSLRKQDLIFFLFGLILFAVLQGLITGRVIGSFWQLNLLFLGINIILTASLNLINGYTGQFSLGHAGFMAIGAYVGAKICVSWRRSRSILLMRFIMKSDFSKSASMLFLLP